MKQNIISDNLNLEQKNFPSNVLLLGTHGTDKIPDFLRKEIRSDFSGRLVRNYSDIGTQIILAGVPEQQKAIPPYGRLSGDPARPKNAPDFIRSVDFNFNPIWKKSFHIKRLIAKIIPFSKYSTKNLARLSSKPYIKNIFAKLELLLKDNRNQNKPIYIIDLHDTSNRLLGATEDEDFLRENATPVNIKQKFRKKFGRFFAKKVFSVLSPDVGWSMPQAILSNASGKTCSKKTLSSLQKALSQQFNIPSEKIELNTVFKGGYITKFFGGTHKNPRLKKLLQKYNRPQQSLQVVQLELNRGLYMNEKQQKLNKNIFSVRKNILSAISPLRNVVLQTKEKINKIITEEE